MTSHDDRLVAEIANARIGLDELSILFDLSARQRRMFLRLAQGPALTNELHAECGIGNPSACAAHINVKLRQIRNPRQITCLTETFINEFGDAGVMGRWSIQSGREAGKPWQNGTNESSTASCAMSALVWSGSAVVAKRASSSKRGASTTTLSARIRA